LKLFRIQKNE